MSDGRFTIKPQDDYWAVVDNYNDDKVCIINGIHTEIEAIWLCDFMNEQQATISALKEENEQLRKQCFELEKDYLIETSDISDKIYLDDEIKELKQKYGVKDE